MGLNLTMPGLIGIVGLAGVVVNDGLIMVDFIKKVTLIFFASGQAKILQPMAVSLGYGIAWATVLNLLYVPLLYAVVYKIKTPKKEIIG